MKILSISAAVVLALAVSTAVVAPANAATATGHKNVTATVSATNTVLVDWDATSGVEYYRVKTSSTPDMEQDDKSYKVSKSNTDFTFNANSSAYDYASPQSGNYIFVRVYAIKSNGKTGESPYQRVRLNPPTESATAQQISVATYNVRTAESEVKGHKWASRIGAVAARIKDSGAAVVALQEAGAHPDDYQVVVTQTASGKKKSRDYNWQFEQLRDAVGAPFQLTSDQEYSDGDGKEGTRILYDASKLTMVDQGNFAPSKVDAYLRFVPWALFANKTTGEQFFFIAAHLDNRKDKAGSHARYDLRLKQIKSVITKARTFAATGAQVIVAGDLNSNIYSVPGNGVDRKMLAAGFIDAYATENNANEFRETFSDFHASKVSASRTDYIMTYGRPDLGGSFFYKNWITKSNGIYASDHNLQSAVLPY